MKLTVIGTGYVGLVTGACFASADNEVVCVDKDRKKIELLKSAEIPFFEPNLQDLVKQSYSNGKLSFQLGHDEKSLSSDIYFIAVGTPQSKDGSVNMDFVWDAAKEIGRGAIKDFIVVNKSTMAIGSTDNVEKIIKKEISNRSLDIKFSVIVNPEFLREGSAVNDFMQPDRVITGSSDSHASEILRDLYKPFIVDDGSNFIKMDTRSAELTKYAANAMLATRISFMNEISKISEAVGADIKLVQKGIGTDKRIGEKFLNAGIGYGGSCFSKDLNALISSSSDKGIDLKLISSVQEVNEIQRDILIKKILNRFKGRSNLEELTVAIWGLSYKPETDDIRDAPSIGLIRALKERGVIIKAYDPQAIDNMRSLLPENKNFSYSLTSHDALEEAQALIICTEWQEFLDFSYADYKGTCLKYILDGRNCLNKDKIISDGFSYEGIGR
jgi:UDPglucose 6-dehydrogenase